ncbi:hypothetical protein H4R24_001864 [Coemansia sp. RSA 988]|nr:hypothetical protein H4R24_001864 [Coemansia sp. RSA 988]
MADISREYETLHATEDIVPVEDTVLIVREYDAHGMPLVMEDIAATTRAHTDMFIKGFLADWRWLHYC